MPIGPHSVYGRKRSAARYTLGRADEAFVEFDSAGGSRCTCDLTELSISGLCFRLDHDPGALFAGATIETATISAGRLASTGHLRVVHVTSGFASGIVCGAEFFPGTPQDEQALARVMARLEERGLRSG